MKRLLLFVLAVAAMICVTVPQTLAEPLVASTFNNSLVRFDSATPGATSTVAVTGLAADDFLLGIDYRPSNGVLYGITTGSTVSRLYTINPLTGAATLVATLTTTPSNTVRVNNSAGIDFNPVPDSQGLPSLRIVTQSGQNLRVNADTGVTIVDGSINGDPPFPSLAGAAYTSNFFGATSTTLYGIDTSSDQLLRFTNPNAGTVVSVGALGIDTATIGGPVGFDISGLTGVAYATLVPTTGPFFSTLYTINLATGQATLVGQIGTANGFDIRGIAALPGNPVPEPTTMLLLSTGLAGIAITVRRRHNKK